MTNTPHGQVPEALRLADEWQRKTQREADRRNSAYDHYGMGNTPVTVDPLGYKMAAKLRRQHARISELEAEIAGGVQALSAAPAVPAGWKLVPAEITGEMSDAWQSAFNKQLHKRVNSRGRLKSAACFKKSCEEVAYVAMLAASPTPTAEQTFITPETEFPASAKGAAITSESGAVYAPMPRAAYIEFDGREETAWHTPDQMRDFADRTHALRASHGPASAGTAIDLKAAAQAIAVEVAKNCGSVPQLTFPHIYLGLKDLLTPTPPAEKQAAPKAAPGEPGWWRKRADEIEAQVALTGSPDAMRCFTDMRTLLQDATDAAPGDALGEVMRERDEAEDFINELLDEVLGADRPEWSSAYNRYDAMSDVRERITALHKPAVDKAWDRFQSATAAPQQEAQEPVMIYHGRCTVDCGEHGHHDMEMLRMIPAGSKLYTAPQPAPAPLSAQDEEAAMYRWLRAQHEDDSGEPRCCVYAPNDMRECLVPVGDMPGELDAFIRAALAAQGGK